MTWKFVPSSGAAAEEDRWVFFVFGTSAVGRGTWLIDTYMFGYMTDDLLGRAGIL